MNHYLLRESQNIFKPFSSQCSLLIPLKTSENTWFDPNQKGTLGRKGLISDNVCILHRKSFSPFLYLYPITVWKVSKYRVFSDLIYSVNLRIQSEYRKIWTRKNSIFGHFSQCVVLLCPYILILSRIMLKLKLNIKKIKLRDRLQISLLILVNIDNLDIIRKPQVLWWFERGIKVN